MTCQNHLALARVKCRKTDPVEKELIPVLDWIFIGWSVSLYVPFLLGNTSSTNNYLISQTQTFLNSYGVF